MSRSLLLRKLGWTSNSFLKARTSRLTELNRDGPCLMYKSLVPQCRSHSPYRYYHSQSLLFPKYREVRNIFNNSFLGYGSVLNVGNRVKYQAQTVWRKASKMQFHRNPDFPQISRLAKALSLASMRYHLVIPSFGLLFGEMFMAQTAYAESDYLSSRDSASVHAENGHAYLTHLLSLIPELLILILRAVFLTVLFTPSLVMAPFADSLGPDFRTLWLRVVHHTLEQAGPAFIKWGQWAATRPDLFPGDLCSELAKLHSKAPEHSFAYTKTNVEKAFGRSISDIFEYFEETPVASGSIAQVHRASLKVRYAGHKGKTMEVAVKVRHPGVGESIRRDFVLINAVARMSNFIPGLRWLRLDESVQQFSVFMMSQVDLAREAAHLNRFIYNFRRWRHVSFPKPVYPLVHPAVLVETYEQGESVARYVDELEGHNRVKAALADIGTHALLKMLLVDNFIHADMHPGNILVRVPLKNSPQKRLRKSKPHVVFLDVGMIAELSNGDRTNLIDFFKAVARRDGITAAQSTLRLSKQQNCPNPEAFIQEVKESFDFWGSPEGDLVHPADCMHQLLEKVRRHRVNIDGNVCTVIVTTLVLEGWQRKLDPTYDMMHTLQTLLLKSDWAVSLSHTIEAHMAP